MRPSTRSAVKGSRLARLAGAAAVAVALLAASGSAALAAGRTGVAAHQAPASARLTPLAGLHLLPAGHVPAGGSASPASTTYYNIVNDDGQCLDADSNHWGSNGDNVQLWSCNSNGEQEWVFVS